MSTRLLFPALALSLAAACGTPSASPTAEARDIAKTTQAEVGQAAPDFTLTSASGETFTLSDHKGKTVVLEWYNPDCPYVVYAHGEGGPLHTWAGETAAKDDVVWVAINSGAAGKQGHGKERNLESKTEYGFDYPVLLDADGQVGMTYGAKTTPHMYVIDTKGTLAYAGALDNAPRGDSDGKEVVNYVDQALTALSKGEAVATAQTRPYGCGVKY